MVSFINGHRDTLWDCLLFIDTADILAGCQHDQIFFCCSTIWTENIYLILIKLTDTIAIV